MLDHTFQNTPLLRYHEKAYFYLNKIELVSHVLHFCFFISFFLRESQNLLKSDTEWNLHILWCGIRIPKIKPNLFYDKQLWGQVIYMN